MQKQYLLTNRSRGSILLPAMKSNKTSSSHKTVSEHSPVENQVLMVTEIGGLVKDLDMLVISSPQDELYNRLIKRTFDIAFSSLVIVFVLSWLYPIIALLIKLESKGPVIFRQERSGKHNESFWCLKFRSMHVNEESHHKQASRNDNRITKIGSFLRRTSLDEFPQFLNVLIGDMSIVGPRPHMLKHTEQYRDVVDNYMARHFLKPGITGWAQINGYRGETTALDAMVKRVQHDIWYLENWSALLDIKIIFSTAYQVLIGDKNAF